MTKAFPMYQDTGKWIIGTICMPITYMLNISDSLMYNTYLYINGQYMARYG